MNSQLLLVSALVASTWAADYRVTVGISQLTGQVGVGFDPNRIVPAVGDTVTFTWAIPSYIQNPKTGSYSVTQGSASAPCQPLSNGLDSGPRDTAPESAGTASTVVVPITDTKPMYFFSSVSDQCKQGMVLGINSPPSGDGSVESYILAAGGDPNKNDKNSTSSANTTSTNMTSKTNSSTTTSNSTSKSPNSTPITNTTSAKPNGSVRLAFDLQTLVAGLMAVTTTLFLGM